MSVAMEGTNVLFAEVDRQAWRSGGTVPFVRAPRYQGNITTRSGQQGHGSPGTGTTVLAVPPLAVPPGPCNRTPATESGESFARGVTDDHAAEAISLHPPDLGLGEQGVRHESVSIEYGVVNARHPSRIRP